MSEPTLPVHLAVLAKAPVPGFAKTRLIPALGAEGAAALHAAMVQHTLATARSAGLAHVSLWCAPRREHPFFAALAEELDLRVQPDGDLGARMGLAFEVLLSSGDPALLVGTDAPELDRGRLRQAALALLGGADAVVVPALDGGYALLGLRRAAPALFEGIRWGTGEVLAATRARLRALGWCWVELAPVRDVDLPEDLHWLDGAGVLANAARWAHLALPERGPGGPPSRSTGGVAPHGPRWGLPPCTG